MLLALAVSALPAAAAGAPPDAAAFTAAATDWVLSGQPLPPDYLQRLAAMAPDQRLLAVVFLRRSGLLEGPAIPAATILAPAPAPEEGQ